MSQGRSHTVRTELCSCLVSIGPWPDTRCVYLPLRYGPVPVGVEIALLPVDAMPFDTAMAVDTNGKRVGLGQGLVGVVSGHGGIGHSQPGRASVHRRDRPWPAPETTPCTTPTAPCTHVVARLWRLG